MNKTNVLKSEQSSQKGFPKATKTFLTLLEFLASHPYDSFALSELAHKSSVPKGTVSRVIHTLEQEGFIKTEEIANLKRIRFNRTSLRALGFKIASNLVKVYESGIAEYIVGNYSNLHRLGTPKAIVLFGSVRKGEDGPGSDIDIAIEVDKETELQILELGDIPRADKIGIALKQFEQNFGRKFAFHFFHRNKIDINLFNNIANGIVLWGFLEVKA